MQAGYSNLSNRPGKMCGLGLILSSQMETKLQNGKMTRKDNEGEKSLTKKSSKEVRAMSNDPTKSCKTFCCCCDQVITLSGLRKHVKSRHQITLTEYKELYGEPRKQIIQLVFHKCAFCQKSILLDTDSLSKHLRKAHQRSYKDYLVRHMSKPSTTDTDTGVQGAGVLGVEEKKLVTPVIIRCDECPKTFKQNIQLKVHKRKHSAK